MPKLEDEVAEMRRLLESLPRKHLQAMAKEYGVRANLRSSEIIDRMLQAADEASKAGAVVDQMRQAGAQGKLVRSGSLGPEDDLVSCFPGSSGSANKSGMASQLASFGKALVGFVTGSPARDAQQQQAQQAPHSHSSTSSSSVPSNRMDARLLKDQTAEDHVPSLNPIDRRSTAAASVQQQLQQQQHHLQPPHPQPGPQAHGSPATAAAMRPPSLQEAAAAALSTVTARMSNLALKEDPAVFGPLSAGNSSRQAARHLSSQAAGSPRAAGRPTAAGAPPLQPPAAIAVAGAPPQQRPASSPVRVAAQARDAAGQGGCSTRSGVAGAQAASGHQLLHTPQRLPSAPARATQRKRWAVPVDPSAGSSVSSEAPAGSKAGQAPCTPPRQATAAAVSTQLASPRPGALGSARRVVPSEGSKEGGRTQLFSPSRKGAAGQAVGTASEAGPTPLKQPARRLAPTTAGSSTTAAIPAAGTAAGAAQGQAVAGAVCSLEGQVQRVLIAHPSAKPGALQGPEPTKQWLMRTLVNPYTRSRSSKGAGYCYRGLLLGGAPGCGKTELVHGLAAGLGARLLYLSPSDLQQTCERQGHVVLRALFQVARKAAPCVLCFDDAHISFPSVRHPDPEHPSHRLRTELLVQLEQLADEQTVLAKALHTTGRSSCASTGSSSSSSTPGPAVKAQRPGWSGVMSPQRSKVAEPKQAPAAGSAAPSCSLTQPVLVLVVSNCPGKVDPAVAAGLMPLTLELPAAGSREDLLLRWLLERDAALGVADVEALVRATANWSMRELVNLCQAAGQVATRQGGSRTVCMADFKAALSTARQAATSSAATKQ